MSYIKSFLLVVLSVLLVSCGAETSTANNTAQPSQASKQQIEILDGIVLTIPEYAFTIGPDHEEYPISPDKKDAIRNTVYLVFYDDKNDKQEKWNNQTIIKRVEGVNSTDDITYDQAKQVIESFASTEIGINAKNYEDITEEYVNLGQTPAMHYTAKSTNKNGTKFKHTWWFFMSNHHDVVRVWFFNNDKAKHDCTNDIDEIIKTMHIKSLDGDLAFRSESTNNSAGSRKDEYKELAKTVYNWCQDRFVYYDRKDGYDTGNKHADDVFEDAAEHFGKSKNEVRKLYDDGGVYVIRGE